MKYPLTQTQIALREIACFFIGHRWKCSWKRNQVSFGDYESLSYRERNLGNPYWECSAGWHYKCRRCRDKTRNDIPFQPFYVNYYRALRHGISSVVFVWGLRNDGDLDKVTKGWYLLYSLTHGLTNLFAELDDTQGWPPFLWDNSVGLEFWFFDRAVEEK